MENLVVTWQTILSICGGVAVIFSAGKLITSAFGPIREIKTRLDRHDELLKRDHQRFLQIDRSDKAQLKALDALLANAETGNSSGLIKSARLELTQFLIEK